MTTTAWIMTVCVAVIAVWVWASGPRAALAKLAEKAAYLALVVLVVVAGWTWWLRPQIAATIARVEAAVPSVPTVPSPGAVKDSVVDAVKGVLTR